MPRRDAAAHAANWRSVLAADAAVGLVPLVVGLLLTGWLRGALLVTAAVYLLLVVRRYFRWRWLRAHTPD
jgi:hypothetical protein